MHGVSKRYGPTVALDGVSLEARPGRVLGLIGENGAGKSTLMKTLAGAVRPDAGAMTLAGARYAPAGPTAARAAGVAMIYQELNLAPDLSVEDNLMLGRERSTYGLLNRGDQRRRCRAALERLGHGGLDVRTPVGRLPVGTRQVVEIARAVLDEARVVVFDEPTSSLPRQEAEALFAVIRTLTADGAAVIYISHFLEEVRTVCDDYAVLRDGRAVGSGELKDVTEPELVTLMVGRPVDDLFPRVPHTPGEALLKVDSLTGAGGMPDDVSSEVRRGEILGLCGLIGAGRTELARAIYGLDAVRSGRVTVRGTTPGAGPRGRIRRGIGFVSEDRAGEGLMLDRTLAENVTLGRLAPLAHGGFLPPAAPNRAAGALMRRLGVKARGPRQAVGELERREPAESRPRPRASSTQRRLAAGRTDPRRGRGRQKRPVPPDGRSRRGGRRRAVRQQLSAGTAGGVRPHRGDAAGPIGRRPPGGGLDRRVRHGRGGGDRRY